MKLFKYYEVLGLVTPGMTFVIGSIVLFWPEERDIFVSLMNISVGSLGFGLLTSYVIGQLLQAVGNLLETGWWALWGGKPTDWIRTDKHNVFPKAMRNQIIMAVHGTGWILAKDAVR